MTHEYAPYGRVGLNLTRLRGARSTHYLPVCTSTQTHIKRLLDLGERPPLLVVTDEQTQGRGRLDRAWQAPAGSAVLMSVGLPPSGHHSAVTLKAGVVVAEALIARGVPARLKWPNDIVIVQPAGLRKLGGILAELHRDHLVIGIGLNVDLAESELPTPEAISCRQVGSTPLREPLIDAIVQGLLSLPASVTLARYRELSATLGAEVQVQRLAAEPLTGTAIDIDADGALLVRAVDGREHRVTVGDVQHVRPAVTP